MSLITKIVLASLAMIALAGAGTGGYIYKHHVNIKAHERAVRQARIARINRQYRADLSQWRSDMAEWEQKSDSYENCKTATSDAFDAGDALRGRIAAGGSYAEYQTALTKFAAKISSATRNSEGNFECLSVIETLDDASGKVSKATNTWLSWMRGDEYPCIESPDD